MGSELPLADELAAMFARTSGLLLSTATVQTALQLITSLTVEMFSGSSGAGISLLDPQGKRVTTAATDAVVERADALQYQLGQGPCLTAWEQHRVVRVDDIAGDDRWPEWARAVAEVGVRSVLSAPLVAGSGSLGAVKVYAAQPRMFGEREERLLTMFATQAAILLANMRSAEDARRVSDTLKDALRGREVITLALGVIMARQGVDERGAFLALADTAQQQGKTMRQAAERIAESTVQRRR
ncbi:MAG: GAF and ANTAR domain-containing protein [Labedaea sp.]